MAVPEHRGILSVLLGLLALASAQGFVAGCSGAPPPEPAPISVPPTTAPPPPPRAPKPPPPKVVEITPADPGPARPSLVEVARAERERRKQSGKSVAVINNKNLQEYAKDGDLTYVTEDGSPAEETPEEAVEETTPGTSTPPKKLPPGADLETQERYWRSRFLELRLEWQRTAEDLEDYEKQAAALRRRFYAEDDPHVRDGQIKPEWDLVLERQAKAREALRRYPRELEHLYEEARAANAERVWTREGIEIQPEPLKDDEEGVPEGQLPIHQVEDPTILNPGNPP